MNKYKVKEVIKMLEEDGWVLMTTKGDHRQFKHPDKKRESHCSRKTKRNAESIPVEQHLEAGRMAVGCHTLSSRIQIVNSN